MRQRVMHDSAGAIAGVTLDSLGASVRVSLTGKVDGVARIVCGRGRRPEAAMAQPQPFAVGTGLGVGDASHECLPRQVDSNDDCGEKKAWQELNPARPLPLNRSGSDRSAAGGVLLRVRFLDAQAGLLEGLWAP